MFTFAPEFMILDSLAEQLTQSKDQLLTHTYCSVLNCTFGWHTKLCSLVTCKAMNHTWKATARLRCFSLNEKINVKNTRWPRYWIFLCFGFSSGLARDCHDLFEQGQRASGVYMIQPEGTQPFNVLCEMTSGESNRSSDLKHWFTAGEGLIKTAPVSTAVTTHSRAKCPPWCSVSTLV